jgi:hypothetical protein
VADSVKRKVLLVRLVALAVVEVAEAQERVDKDTQAAQATVQAEAVRRKQEILTALGKVEMVARRRLLARR